jgi:hypothetical protein
MRTGIKVLLIFGLFMIYGAISLALKGGDSTRAGVGGPIGLIVLFACFAGAVAIWKYNPDKDTEKQNDGKDKHQLDKNNS